MTPQTPYGQLPAYPPPAPARESRGGRPAGAGVALATLGLLLEVLAAGAFGPFLAMGSDSCTSSADPRLICSTGGQGLVSFGPVAVGCAALALAVGGGVLRPRHRAAWYLLGYALTTASFVVAFQIASQPA